MTVQYFNCAVGQICHSGRIDKEQIVVFAKQCDPS
jgi:hypothetical protein